MKGQGSSSLVECLASRRALDSVIREHKSSRNFSFSKKIEHHPNDISWSERADPNHVWSDSLLELKIPLLMFARYGGASARDRGPFTGDVPLFLSFHRVSSVDQSLVFRPDHSSIYPGAPLQAPCFPSAFRCCSVWISLFWDQFGSLNFPSQKLCGPGCRHSDAFPPHSH